MTILFGTVAVFVTFILSVWLGDLGVYLPLTVWIIFAMGNFFGMRNALVPALLAATLSGLTYDRGAAGFLEQFVPFFFWFIMHLCGKRYVFGTISSWLPGLCTGMCAALVLYGSRIISGGWQYEAEWMSFAVNILFSGIIGVFILPMMIWTVSLFSGKLGLETKRSGVEQ